MKTCKHPSCPSSASFSFSIETTECAVLFYTEKENKFIDVVASVLSSLLFSLRAAQKLNLASKKKKQKTAAVTAPVTSSSQSCDPALFPTNFSSALLMAPPPAPPCLLRAANKIKDTPGLGKVTETYFERLWASGEAGCPPVG